MFMSGTYFSSIVTSLLRRERSIISGIQANCATTSASFDSLSVSSVVGDGAQLTLRYKQETKVSQEQTLLRS